MSSSYRSHPLLNNVFHPFKQAMNKANLSVSTMPVDIDRGYAQSDFANRLGYLIGEKTALKLNYQDIERDLQEFNFDISADSKKQSKPYNINLDKIRLKFSINAMSFYLDSLFSGEEHTKDIEHIHSKFQTETSNVFKILSRDFHNISRNFEHQLKHTNKADISVIEKNMQEHLEAYNMFSDMLSFYFEMLTKKI